MTSLKKIFLLYILINFSFSFGEHWVMTSFAQNRKIDSLIALIKKDKPDTNKVIHLNSLVSTFMYQNPDSAIILTNQALKIITPVSSPEFLLTSEDIVEDERIGYLRAQTLGNLGLCYYYKADYPRALDYFLKALKIYKKIQNKKGTAVALGNIGNIYKCQANYSMALDSYLKVLKMGEELKNKRLIAVALGNIGIIYLNQQDYPKALDYYLKSLKIHEELDDKYGIGSCFGKIGTVYVQTANYSKALDYYLKALKVDEELGDKTGIATRLGNIGRVHLHTKDFPKALNYCFKALKIYEELGNKKGIAHGFNNIGEIYASMGKFREAEKHLKVAMSTNESIGALDELRLTEEALSQLYDTTGRYKLALIHYKKSIALKDTLFSQENKQQLVRKEMNYEFDKKEAATKAEHEKEIAVAAAEKKKQQFILILVSCVLILIFLFAGFIFRSLRITRKQKNIIELQKNEVFRQKEIAEKQKEKITDSITYAQRIQQSILMDENEIQTYLPDSFIYYQPKDIVSGDFYWCSKINDKIILAAIDCTGHGVPGAFMSMIGNTLLNQIVNEQHVTTPSEILRLLNLGVYEALHQKKEDALSNDGMDISVCTIDYKHNILQFAGAQNPLFIVLDNKIEIIKGNKFGIGGGGMIIQISDPLKKEFTNHTIPIKKDMNIYLFSDGYADQFGGSERKKFGQQQFKELLFNCQNLSMVKQKERFATAHTEWKGSIPQIDDMLVIGVKI